MAAAAGIIVPLVLFACSLAAQPLPVAPPGTADASGIVLPRVRVTVSKQPLAVFQAALGSKLQGVAGYSARSCAMNGQGSTFSGGLLEAKPKP